jgi:hypothetical protein
MAVFIWIVILGCIITTPALSRDTLSTPVSVEDIRIEGKLFSYDSLTFQRTESWPGRRVHVKLLDGDTYQGRLLYAADDFLFAGPDKKPSCCAASLDSFEWSFRYDQIERVNVLGGANFWKGFAYAFVPILILGVASSIDGDKNDVANAAVFTAAAGIPLGLIGGFLGAGEDKKKNGPIYGNHKAFQKRVPYWQKCARYKRKTTDMHP